MAKYSVSIRAPAEAEFRAVPSPFRRQLNQLVFKLMRDPRPAGSELVEGRLHKLTAHGWQIAYEVDDVSLIVTVVSFAKLNVPSA